MTKRVCIAMAAAAGFLAAGCGGGNASTLGPSGTAAEFGGVEYTATVDEIVSSTVRRFTVVATLRNTRDAAVTRSYPAGCPVRVRLYRALDNQLVYDETKIECAVTTETSLTIAPGGTRTLQSGVRWPPTVIGDSLAATTYNVRAVVQTEGATLVEVSAGVYKMPDCREVFPPDSQGRTECT